MEKSDFEELGEAIIKEVKEIKIEKDYSILERGIYKLCRVSDSW
jgi:hypothetical protein